MADISVQIVFPVAVPQRFLGGPVLISASFILVWMMLAMACFVTVTYAMMGIFCMVAMIPTQMVVILYGRREPHADNLLRLLHLFYRTTRVVGNGRSKVFYAG